MKRKKSYTSEEKTIILRELLEENVPVSDLADKYGVHPNAIYKWKQLFESAPESLARKKRNSDKLKEKDKQRIADLERTLNQRERLIAEIVRENVELKKNTNGGL